MKKLNSKSVTHYSIVGGQQLVKASYLAERAEFKKINNIEASQASCCVDETDRDDQVVYQPDSPDLQKAFKSKSNQVNAQLNVTSGMSVISKEKADYKNEDEQSFSINVDAESVLLDSKMRLLVPGTPSDTKDMREGLDSSTATLAKLKNEKKGLGSSMRTSEKGSSSLMRRTEKGPDSFMRKSSKGLSNKVGQKPKKKSIPVNQVNLGLVVGGVGGGEIFVSSGQASKEEKSNKKFRLKRYKSRLDVNYEDTDSVGREKEDDGHCKSEQASKTRMKKLVDESQNLVKAVEQNQQMLEVEKLKQQFNENADQEVKPNRRFKYFNDQFTKLVQSRNVKTFWPLISCTISYNSQLVITVSKRNDQIQWIRAYDIDGSNEMHFEEEVKGCFVKFKEVEQNDDGDHFALAYIDNGTFKVRTFPIKVTKEACEHGGDAHVHRRSPQEIEDDEINLNQILKIDCQTQVIYNMPDPYITCCFVGDEILFVNLFHNPTLTHHHFFYNFKQRYILSHYTKLIDCNFRNFPFKCFYNSKFNQIFSFYRQGQGFRIVVPKNMGIDDENEEPKVEYQQVSKLDLGEMFLYRNKILITRSSKNILFFKLKHFFDDQEATSDRINDSLEWINYHSIPANGRIYFMRFNKHIQVTTKDQIYFYSIDEKTGLPDLANVMNNFMDCNNMMYGLLGRYSVTYKTNQRSFDIYRRKYEHDFKVNVVTEDFEGSKAIYLTRGNVLIVYDKTMCKFYHAKDFTPLHNHSLCISLKPSTDKIHNQVLAMQKSPDEDFLAVISGKILQNETRYTHQLFIFKRKIKFNTKDVDHYEEFDRYPDFDEMIGCRYDNEETYGNQICTQFHFKTPSKREANTLIFCNKFKIFQLNFEYKTISIIDQFVVPMQSQPSLFWITENQHHYILASKQDGWHYNAVTRKFIDIDLLYEIDSIKEIGHDHEDKCFFILSNRCKDRYGLFLIRFEEADPTKYNFIMKISNSLEINDCDIQVVTTHSGEHKEGEDKQTCYKELIVSYKSIYVNTYTIFVIDMSTRDYLTIFKHISPQQWESRIYGTYLEKNMEYVTINKDGISVISLSNSYAKRPILRSGQKHYMLHALESVNYLKFQNTNLIQFDFLTEKKEISIVNQYKVKNQKTGNIDTKFERLMLLKVDRLNLRELLLLSSLYVCNTQSDILNLVQAQPSPEIFLKTFLEFDLQNLVFILSFDSRCIKVLLDPENSEYFQCDTPIFYKNRVQKKEARDKFFYISALDFALKNNQVRALSHIINHIVKYQNNYVSSFLFIKNINRIIKLGCHMADLFASNIFCYQFDYDEWPSSHNDDSYQIRPYNGGIFELRMKYYDVFPEEKFKILTELEEDAIESDSLHKIKYKMNMLSCLDEHVVEDPETGKISFGNENISMIDLLCEQKGHCALEVFEEENFVDLLDFRWNAFALRIWIINFLFHIGYMCILLYFCFEVYIDLDEAPFLLLNTILFGAIIYPLLYELWKVYKQGLRMYLSKFGNFSVIIYLCAGLVNTYMQAQQQIPENSFRFQCKFLTSLIMLQQIPKTFNYLKIRQDYTYLTIMLGRVFFDLIGFGILFLVLIFQISMMIAVIGYQNPNIPGKYRDAYLENQKKAYHQEMLSGEEYLHMMGLMQYIVSTTRLSIGDFDFDAIQYLDEDTVYLYWTVWFVSMLILNIVFLNFIVAELSNTYTDVKENLNAMQNYGKAQMISEIESIYPNRLKCNKYFPKYIIIRDVEN